jgi:hypothetical protein
MSSLPTGKQRTRMTQTDSHAAAPTPTEHNPRRGEVVFGEVLLSEAEYFVDETGTHVIRSMEFDISAHADTFDDVVDHFLDNVEDYCSYLADQAQASKASEVELESLNHLVPRVLRVSRLRRETSDDLAATLLRRVLRKHPPVATWRPQTTRTSSSEHSSV